MAHYSLLNKHNLARIVTTLTPLVQSTEPIRKEKVISCRQVQRRQIESFKIIHGHLPWEQLMRSAKKDRNSSLALERTCDICQKRSFQNPRKFKHSNLTVTKQQRLLDARNATE